MSFPSYVVAHLPPMRFAHTTRLQAERCAPDPPPVRPPPDDPPLSDNSVFACGSGSEFVAS